VRAVIEMTNRSICYLPLAPPETRHCCGRSIKSSLSDARPLKIEHEVVRALRGFAHRTDVQRRFGDRCYASGVAQREPMNGKACSDIRRNWSIKMRRVQYRELVADYFTRGGAIRRLPTPEPTSPSDVLDYLSECNFRVYPAPRGEGQQKYVYQGQVVTLDKLVSIANEHRALVALPPFQLTTTPVH
jgi:hypothetical protein